MQIIVVDDASEDDGVNRVKAWSRNSGQPVQILCNSKRLYSYGSRLKGFAYATAPVVWSIDADDCIPPNSDILDALAIMERDCPDILHCKACGVQQGSTLQEPLTWTEPVALELEGRDIFRTFLSYDYPPVILWNKFFSARLMRAVLAAAPKITVRYFDVKFLGLLFLLYAQSYKSCNALIYQYKMRAHRSAQLYAKQVDAMIRLEKSLLGLVESEAAEQKEAFLDYCQRRLTIQVGHLSIMAEFELRESHCESDTSMWLAQNIWENIERKDFFSAILCSIQANAKRIASLLSNLSQVLESNKNIFQNTSFTVCPEMLLSAAEEYRNNLNNSEASIRLTKLGFALGRSLTKEELSLMTDRNCSDALAVSLLLANARLARTITAVLAPKTDITKKAN